MDETQIKTRFYPRTPKRPYGRVKATVTSGPHEGRKETFKWDGPGAHLRAAQRLVTLIGIPGTVVEVKFGDTGSTFKVIQS